MILYIFCIYGRNINIPDDINAFFRNELFETPRIKFHRLTLDTACEEVYIADRDGIYKHEARRIIADRDENEQYGLENHAERMLYL